MTSLQSPLTAASLAAMMVSTDSSPTFSRILFKPLWYRLATYELSAAAPLRSSSTWARRVRVSLMFMPCGIDGVRIFQDRVDGCPVAVLVDAIEAALAAGMASDVSDLLDHQNDDVGVAVQAHLVQGLHMAGLFALAPQLATGTRPVNGAVLGSGQFQCFAVHPGHHQDAPGLVILGNRRHQAVSVPLDLVQPILHQRLRYGPHFKNRGPAFNAASKQCASVLHDWLSANDQIQTDRHHDAS